MKVKDGILLDDNGHPYMSFERVLKLTKILRDYGPGEISDTEATKRHSEFYEEVNQAITELRGRP